MKIQLLPFSTFLVALIALLSSCRTHGPAFLANADPYMAKPVYRGETESAFYLSCRINSGYEYYANEENNSSEVSAHVGLMGEYIYFAGGFFGFWGNYKVNPVNATQTRGGRQAFNGFGGRGELGARIPLRAKADLLLGINGEIFKEGGKYTENSSDLFTSFLTLGTNTTYVNAAPAAELRFAPTPVWDFGFRYSLDSYRTLINVLETEQSSFLHRLTLHSTYDQFTVYGQAGFTADKQRVFSLGLAYGFPFGKKKAEGEAADMP